jgi:two-component system KDP operon response regulator KdpE
METVLNKTNYILIVEDNFWIGSMVLELLETEGYTVKYVDTAFKALDLLRQERADLIILDIGLPDKNGNEFLEELAQLDPTMTAIPVVVISANMSRLKPSPQIKAALDKPFDLEKLLAIVAQNI